MPKPLTLKKSKSGPPKNQKAITQFFKTPDRLGSATESQNSVIENRKDSVTGKRKATSPLLSESKITNLKLNDGDEYCVHSLELDRYTKLSPMKQDIQNVEEKRSPLKENHPKSDLNRYNLDNNTKLFPLKHDSQNIQKSSPPKENDSNKNSNVFVYNDVASKGQVNNDVFNINQDKRSPLSDVSICKLDNHLINHDKNVYLDGNHLRHKDNKYIQLLGHDSSQQEKFMSSMASPKKSPKNEEIICSPKISKWTPEKTSKHERSPSKCGSTIRALNFDQHQVDDLFADSDEWQLDEDGLEDSNKNNLDLSSIQRCQVVALKSHPTRLELHLKNGSGDVGICYVEGIWLDTPLSTGEVVSVQASRNEAGEFSVSNSSGLLVLRPDHLMSSTSVVAGVFCKRKALLQERWRGIDSANTAMTIGILIHELVQKALTQNIICYKQLSLEANKIIQESIQRLYDAGLTEEEARSNMQTYIQPLADFMQLYVADKPSTNKHIQKDQWSGHIDKVLDIEENVCCPQLGLKGKIDATLEVTLHDRKGRTKALVPLELKSGKASMSAEHRGQLVLYGMMLSAQRGGDVAREPQRGLLLYLKERVALREVSCGYPERRDLIMLRNQLVRHLNDATDTEQLPDIEEASRLLQQRLPEPVHHEAACAKCPYLTLCSLHLWHTDGPVVAEEHPLRRLRGQALGHLTEAHVQYFRHWTALLRIEERAQAGAAPLHALWTDTVDIRTKRGTCASNLKLKSVEASGDRYLHRFTTSTVGQVDSSDENGTVSKGPQEGDFSIVSVDQRPWIAAGAVTAADGTWLHVLLERDLSRRLTEDTLYHIDTYESYASTVQNLTNLGVLMEDSDRAARLRRLIIDGAAPQFELRLERAVGRLGARLMRSLNIEQQRAVLRALAARDYALLQGLPGTGKTQTISVLIQMLVGLKQRVLVTAHTHSAVDTVLSRLPDSVRVMRLGAAARVAPGLLPRTEPALTADCRSPAELEQLYNSMEVVGVTCLGAAHAMLSRTTFDVCIVDEATQVLQSTVLRPLFAAKRFVLVGDPDQLPPVVRSKTARRLGMEVSLFHRLMSEEATCTLRLQYRMNQPLTDVANRVAYSGRLKCADESVALARLSLDVQKISNLDEWLKRACSPEPEDAALFIDVQPLDDSVNGFDHSSSKTCTNEAEACVVYALVDALKQCGVEPSAIGVVAPYREQVALLRRGGARLAVEASTVDQFQGRDKPAVLYSCTRRHRLSDAPHHTPKEGEVLNDQRRLAVSVTRAKHKLIVVGDGRALRKYAPLQRLLDACARVALPAGALDALLHKYRTFLT